MFPADNPWNRDVSGDPVDPRSGAYIARIGAATNRAETVLNSNRSRQTTIQADLSKAEDVDLTEAITDVNRQQAAYEAALGATAKSIQQSLVDFLR